MREPVGGNYRGLIHSPHMRNPKVMIRGMLVTVEGKGRQGRCILYSCAMRRLTTCFGWKVKGIRREVVRLGTVSQVYVNELVSVRTWSFLMG
jgi:hypothetical protein